MSKLNYKSYAYLYKIIILGMNCSGKTSICNTYTLDNHLPNIYEPKADCHDIYQPTVGIDYHSKILQITESLSIKVNLWDTAGQEMYRSLIQLYYRDCCAAIIVYDITNRRSFYQLKYWINELKKNSTCKEINHEHKILILGNKCDLTDKRTVSYQEASEFAINNNCIFKEVSILSSTILCENITDFIYLIHDELHNLECSGVRNINNTVSSKFVLTPKPLKHNTDCKYSPIGKKESWCFCNII